MIKSPYITVAVTLPVMNTYTYSMPEHLKKMCAPGMRVLVPFGRRRVTGYIISEKKQCKGFKAKKILDVLDDHSLFPESQIRFFKWISEYYIHPMGEVIKSALPSGLDRHDVLCVFVEEKGRKILGNGSLSAGEEMVLEYVAGRKSCPMKQLLKAHPGVSALVRKMEKKDLIMVSAVLKKDGVKIKNEKFITPGTGEPTPIRMSKKRLKILSIVKDKKEISLTGLKADVPTASTLIKPLAQAGYVKITERQVFRDPLGEPVEPDTPPMLTQEQAGVVDRVLLKMDKGYSPYLLSGVTGSGKTEVYMRLVQDVVKNDKRAIVLVPEISLISQTERRFRARFGNKIAVIHSSLTKGELLDQWRKIALNKVDIVIGARSCIFAPFENIGLIIVDEEHDSSYKQETGLRYNARDLAVVRAKQNNCPVILGSATPSVQSYQNVSMGRFKELKLHKRVNQYPLPEISLVDLKKYQDAKGFDRIITPKLALQIRKCLDSGNQALIFLNRRGYATSPVCRDCGKSLHCRYCDVTLTFHKGYNEYRCHLCGDKRNVNVRCPSCKSSKIRPLGFGTERVETIMKDLFPDARIARMDQDTTSAKGATVRILKNIRNRNVDIVVGTQMLAKGHDFPSITLVGVVCADLSLNLPDFRAGERTFQLLAQVAGRAGRGDTPGKVIMQTYNPEHFIIEASRKQDFREFFQNEAPFRKALMYPPFSRMIQLKISGGKKPRVERFALSVSEVLQAFLEEEGNQTHPVQILGPIEAAIGKISSMFRWQILLKSPSSALLNRMVSTMMDHPKTASRSGIRLVIDVDPYFLM